MSLYGGIMLFIAIAAVVEGVPTTSQTPVSGHFSPVLASVPNGFLAMLSPLFLRFTLRKPRCRAPNRQGVKIRYFRSSILPFTQTTTARAVTRETFVNTSRVEKIIVYVRQSKLPKVGSFGFAGWGSWPSNRLESRRQAGCTVLSLGLGVES